MIDAHENDGALQRTGRWPFLNVRHNSPSGIVSLHIPATYVQPVASSKLFAIPEIAGKMSFGFESFRHANSKAAIVHGLSANDFWVLGPAPIPLAGIDDTSQETHIRSADVAYIPISAHSQRSEVSVDLGGVPERPNLA